ncbi:hypothetical protein TI01_2538 [Lysobacter sp. A03]|nr:hypothetical protein TI01_2538 [Lysobacter sp. A03]
MTAAPGEAQTSRRPRLEHGRRDCVASEITPRALLSSFVRGKRPDRVRSWRAQY